MILRIALLLLLSCASLPLFAGEVFMDSAEIDAGCQAECAAVVEVDPDDAVHGISPGDEVEAASAVEATTAKPAEDPESAGRPPRMHNLIPGMFR